MIDMVQLKVGDLISICPMSVCGEGNGTPLQYSHLENPMDRGAWWAAVHRVSKSWTQLSPSTREGNGTPLQYSCLENPMDRGAWWAAVHGVEKSRTLPDLSVLLHLSCVILGNFANLSAYSSELCELR